MFGLLGLPARDLPLGVALLALVASGAAVDWWAGSHVRAAPVALVLVVARIVAVSAVQGWVGGQSAQWALNALTTTAITLQWEWSPKVSVPVTAALVAAHVAATGPDGAGVVVLRVVLECALARLAFVLLRRSSRRVDVLRERRAALEREELLARERHRREREYLALLHDTAAATFLLVAVHGEHTDPGRVAEYARHDLAVLTGTSGAPGAQDSEVDLRTSLGGVVEGSQVDVVSRWDEVPLVPASVALAMLRALREALANVERHAGVGFAELDVRRRERGVVVSLRDSGTGFRLDEVPTSRRGIRGSVVERMASVGGNASVDSAPGTGTLVRLEWPSG